MKLQAEIELRSCHSSEKEDGSEISWNGSFDFGLLIRTMGRDKIEKVPGSTQYP